MLGAGDTKRAPGPCTEISSESCAIVVLAAPRDEHRYKKNLHLISPAPELSSLCLRPRALPGRAEIPADKWTVQGQGPDTPAVHYVISEPRFPHLHNEKPGPSNRQGSLQLRIPRVCEITPLLPPATGAYKPIRQKEVKLRVSAPPSSPVIISSVP